MVEFSATALAGVVASQLKNEGKYASQIHLIYSFRSGPMRPFAMMVERSKFSAGACVSLLSAVAIFAQPTAAHAGDRGFGAGVAAGIVGGMIGGALLQGQFNRGPAYYGQPGVRRGKSAKPNDDDQAKGTQRTKMPSQDAVNVVFNSISVSKDLGSVGEPEPIDATKPDPEREKDRDYVAAIQRFLETIRSEDAKQNSRGDSSLAQGDVTQHAIDVAVTQAYEDKNHKFATFEQYVGEQWTNERLRVAILNHAGAKLPELLKGNNRGRVTMDQVKEIIDQAADAIYDQTLETSELIGLNYATARFTRALYESRGAKADSLADGVEDMLLTASTSALADFQERFVRAGELGVIMHYRAERILIDCLSTNIKTITGTRDEASTRSDMKRKVATLVSDGALCRRWVDSAIGDAKQRYDDDDKRMFRPYPVRAVWIDGGDPRTDASMFRRVTSAQ
jgi:hypothetical protein